MNYKLTSGIIVLIIDLFIIFYRRDIIFELFSGRPLNEIEISKLLLPLILLVISIYLMINRKSDATSKKSK